MLSPFDWSKSRTIRMLRSHWLTSRSASLKWSQPMTKSLLTRYNLIDYVCLLSFGGTAALSLWTGRRLEQDGRWQPQTLRMYSAKQPLTLKLIEERVVLVLNLYDKIDATKVWAIENVLSTHRRLGLATTTNRRPVQSWSIVCLLIINIQFS